ncbi:hypothetical protein CCACVL1_04033, partial [Corchorus capsularis]
GKPKRGLRVPTSGQARKGSEKNRLEQTARERKPSNQAA